MIAGKDISREISAGDMAEMQTAVSVRPGYGHQYIFAHLSIQNKM
jgi:hypothetical protein